MMDKVYTKQEAYDYAMQYLNSTRIMHWDDLPDVNSLWDYIEGGFTEQEIIAAADVAYHVRFTEDFEDSFDMFESL